MDGNAERGGARGEWLEVRQAGAVYSGIGCRNAARVLHVSWQPHGKSGGRSPMQPGGCDGRQQTRQARGQGQGRENIEVRH